MVNVCSPKIAQVRTVKLRNTGRLFGVQVLQLVCALRELVTQQPQPGCAPRELRKVFKAPHLVCLERTIHPAMTQQYNSGLDACHLLARLGEKRKMSSTNEMNTTSG